MRSEPEAGQLTALRLTLARIFSRALGDRPVDPDSHFFDLGGNSIASMVISAQARDLGLPVTARMIFDHPTVRELSAALMAASPDDGARATTAVVRLAPDQMAFLTDRDGAVDGRLVRLADWVRPESLPAALSAVIGRHDALRPRVGPDRVAVASDRTAAVAHYDGVRTEEVVATTAGVLDPENGPLLAAAVLADGDGPPLLMLLAHRLAVDATSWSLLLDDLALACEQSAHGEPIALPAPPTSFSSWAGMLTEWAAGPEAAAERPHWSAPVAEAAGEANSVRTVAIEVAAMPAEAVCDALVAGLLEQSETVDLRCDGRRGLFADRDFSRTVGPFTSWFPVTVDLDPADTAAERMRAVTKARAGAPHGGVGYGALRWLVPGLDRPPARLGVECLDLTGRTSAFTVVGRPDGLPRRARIGRADAVDVLALAYPDRLVVEASFDPSQHDEQAITRLLRHAVAAAPTTTTTTEFPLSGLDQAQLDQLLARLDTAGKGGDQ
ncbi:condensation domain-containing protein [Kutzneria sp. NPDC052558]|uniref:condensation domain-containing protein n=1 Tax=Kutzneria sp. NPDC052558 TaxID=3364121 RepID=UPI0037C72581